MAAASLGEMGRHFVVKNNPKNNWVYLFFPYILNPYKWKMFVSVQIWKRPIDFDHGVRMDTVGPQLVRVHETEILFGKAEFTASRSIIFPLRFSVLLHQQIFAHYAQACTHPGGWSLDGVYPCTWRRFPYSLWLPFIGLNLFAAKEQTNRAQNTRPPWRSAHVARQSLSLQFIIGAENSTQKMPGIVFHALKVNFCQSPSQFFFQQKKSTS